MRITQIGKPRYAIEMTQREAEVLAELAASVNIAPRGFGVGVCESLMNGLKRVGVDFPMDDVYFKGSLTPKETTSEG